MTSRPRQDLARAGRPGDEVTRLIAELELAPHPEGGHYREIIRSSETVLLPGGRAPRSALTVIYFLLARGERSRWHRVRQEETWWHVRGGPLRIALWNEITGAGRVETIGASGEEIRPFLTIPGGWWQAAEPGDAFGLAACFVAPGFEFEDLRLAVDDDVVADRIRHDLPDEAHLL